MRSSSRQATASMKSGGASAISRSLTQAWTVAWRFTSGRDSSLSKVPCTFLSSQAASSMLMNASISPTVRGGGFTLERVVIADEAIVLSDLVVEAPRDDVVVLREPVVPHGA